MASMTFKEMVQDKRERNRFFLGLAFVSPWLIGLLLFSVYPLITSLWYSFTRYDLIQPPVFIGLDNYIRTFTRDGRFWTVMYNTAYYVFLSVPISVGTAFLIANLLNSRIIGRSIFRGIIYIPSIVPAVCTAMIWLFLLNIQYGAVNSILQTLGLKAIPFLSNPSLSKPTLIMIAAWASGGAVVIFLASLQDVPRTLYEAATVDGANAIQKFFNVTIPLCSPVILFSLIIGFIGAWQEFTLPWLLTAGGPAASTELYALHLYRNAFQNLRMGNASALAWILFVIILIFTVILFRTSARWVYYGGGDK